MPAPTVITDLSATAASNYPAGSDAPSTLDDVQRAHAGFIRNLLDATQTQAYTAFTTGGTTTAYTLTPSPALAALAAGQRFRVKFNATNTSTTPTLAISGLTAKSIKVYDSAGAKADPAVGSFAANMLVDLEYDGTDYVAPWVIKTLSLAQGGTNNTTGPVLRSYLAGYGLSTDGSSATMSIAAGTATDSTNVTSIIGSAIAKTTSAWAVGTDQGGLDTGSIANSTWYHFYVIRRPDTGVVDVLFSLSHTAPTLPANYTQFRRIGSGRTNGSAQWVKFFQYGDDFTWDVATLDVNSTNPGTAAVTPTLTVPTGVRVKALLNVSIVAASNNVGAALQFSDPSITDTAPSQTAAPLGSVVSNSSGVTTDIKGGQVSVYTNTSAQVRYRLDNSSASTVVRIVTLGWVDTRGRNE